VVPRGKRRRWCERRRLRRAGVLAARSLSRGWVPGWRLDELGRWWRRRWGRCRRWHCGEHDRRCGRHGCIEQPAYRVGGRLRRRRRRGRVCRRGCRWVRRRRGRCYWIRQRGRRARRTPAAGAGLGARVPGGTGGSGIVVVRTVTASPSPSRHHRLGRHGEHVRRRRHQRCERPDVQTARVPVLLHPHRLAVPSRARRATSSSSAGGGRGGWNDWSSGYPGGGGGAGGVLRLSDARLPVGALAITVGEGAAGGTCCSDRQLRRMGLPVVRRQVPRRRWRRGRPQLHQRGRPRRVRRRRLHHRRQGNPRSGVRRRRRQLGSGVAARAVPGRERLLVPAGCRGSPGARSPTPRVGTGAASQRAAQRTPATGPLATPTAARASSTCATPSRLQA
jgi:hypothetical protein